MNTPDPVIRGLLAAISEALAGMADWLIIDPNRDSEYDP